MIPGSLIQYYGSHGWQSVTLLELCSDGKHALVNHVVTGKRKVAIADLKAVEEGK